MKLRIKHNITTARALVAACIPADVVDQVLGKAFEVSPEQPWTIQTAFKGALCSWNIPQDCGTHEFDFEVHINN